MHTHYVHLFIAIGCEVVGTFLLKEAQGFTKLLPTLATAIFYAAAFFFLSLTLKSMSTGLAYAIWSGVGILLISTISWLFQGQRLDVPALLGIGLIIGGVAVITLASETTSG